MISKQKSKKKLLPIGQVINTIHFRQVSGQAVAFLNLARLTYLDHIKFTSVFFFSELHFLNNN